MKRWGLLLLTLGITACSASPQVRIASDKYETEQFEISIERPVFEIDGFEEFSAQLNERISGELDETAKAFEAEITASPVPQKCTLDIKQEINYDKNHFISVTEERNSYTGGAHGTVVRKTRNIDTLAGCELTLGDLFAEEGYAETLERMIRDLREKNPAEYEELWEEPTIKPQQNFYITDDDLVLYYQPYELSYYARGFVEFPLRLSSLRGYLKEEYYRLAGTGAPN